MNLQALEKTYTTKLKHYRFNATSTIIHGGFTSGPTTKNWTHTTSGSNRLLVLFADIWQDVGGTGTITSATYNGTSLTKAT